MPDLDIRKLAESIADLLAAYTNQFLSILSRPRSTFAGIFEELDGGRGHRFRNALVYAATSVLIGLCVANFVKLQDSPPGVKPEIAIAVLFVWILVALVLHPCLKVFRARGTMEATLVVFLYVVSTLHLVFIPTLAIVGHLITETRVVLTYHYVVYFGANREDRWAEMSPDTLRKALSEKDLAYLWGIRRESYVKERELEKEGTILPPAPPKESLRLADVPLSPSDRVRVPIEESGLDPPKRTEIPIIGESYQWLLLGIWVFYYLINSAYLAVGLACAHRMSAAMLFGLALVGPLVAIVAFTLLLAIWVGIFLLFPMR